MVPIDDLVLDHAFDVVPSLAYMKGIDDSGTALSKTAFVFLQANLLLADGALRWVARRLADGAQVVNATYLRADRVRLLEKLSATEIDGRGLSPRTLVQHAIECLDIRDLANVVNSELSLFGEPGRFFWQHDRSTLLAHDCMPSLVALRPSSQNAEARGFRDVAFASVLCPDAPAQHATDSDEFFGLELTDVAPETCISVGHRTVQSVVRTLSASTKASQCMSAHEHATVFHGGEVPPGLSRTRASAYDYVKGLVQGIGPPHPAVDQPQWKVAHYLWQVRRFELRRGPLPRAPFAELFPRSAAVATGASAAIGSHRLSRLARTLREFLLGRVPLVTFLHPEWLDYRRVMPVLRRAMRGDTRALLYVGDDVALFGRVLGAAAVTSAQLLDGSYERMRPRAGTLDVVLMELSQAALPSWGQLVAKVLPAIKPDGRIVLFHGNVGSLSGAAFKRALAGGLPVSASRFKRLSISVVAASGYRTWLRRGYPIAQDYVRLRRPLSMLKGAALFSILNAMTLILNVAHLGAGADDTSIEACSSLTITIEL